MRNQLLVLSSAVPAAAARLAETGHTWCPITTLMTGLNPSPSGEDVSILHVNGLKHDEDIFDVAHDLRKNGPPVLQNEPRNVSPNHILVPAASEDHSCPFGPPVPTKRGHLFKPAHPQQLVVIIDSGYQWRSTWGLNPLRPIGHQAAEYIDDRGCPGPGKWRRSASDTPDAINPGTLGALSGHANFIAGVIRQRTSHAAIRIVNHNGGFQRGRNDLPTEASVVRSLCRCLALAPSVINLGFAFSAFDDTASWAWNIGLSVIGSLPGGNGPVVFAPAGNQADARPRYPAALNYTYKDKYPHVVGVGATRGLDNLNVPVGPSIPLDLLKPFSNHGPWVTCSADGAAVESTFLKVDMRTEDGPPAVSFDFKNGWAVWNGTSFATPKVVAEVVNVMVASTPPMSALAAWDWVRENRRDGQNNQLGSTFPF